MLDKRVYSSRIQVTPLAQKDKDKWKYMEK